jgi:hypothetical protein
LQRNCGRKGKKKADRSSTIIKEGYHAESVIGRTAAEGGDCKSASSMQKRLKWKHIDSSCLLHGAFSVPGWNNLWNKVRNSL